MARGRTLTFFTYPLVSKIIVIDQNFTFFFSVIVSALVISDTEWTTVELDFANDYHTSFYQKIQNIETKFINIKM